MKPIIRISQIIIFICITGLFAQNKVYQVNKIKNEIVITGAGTDKLWEQATELSDFSYPWREEEPPKTVFKALWSDVFFYFLFTVRDDDIVTSQKGLGEKDLLKSDRVEIFFKSDDIHKPYYSLEMDAFGRCLDTEGVFGTKVDFNWNWPEEHFVLKASRMDGGYIVEGSISLESLQQLGLYHDDGKLLAGLYRGEFFTTKKNGIGVKWISWVLPLSKSFHVPSSFGVLELMN